MIGWRSCGARRSWRLSSARTTPPSQDPHQMPGLVRQPALVWPAPVPAAHPRRHLVTIFEASVRATDLRATDLRATHPLSCLFEPEAAVRLWPALPQM